MGRNRDEDEGILPYQVGITIETFAPLRYTSAMSFSKELLLDDLRLPRGPISACSKGVQQFQSQISNAIFAFRISVSSQRSIIFATLKESGSIACALQLRMDYGFNQQNQHPNCRSMNFNKRGPTSR